MCTCKTCADKGCINCKCHKEAHADNVANRILETLERLEEKIDTVDQDVQKIGKQVIKGKS